MNSIDKHKVLIVGAGLAGVEAAHFLANKGIEILLAECKEITPNPAQRSKNLAELVCSNSLKSKDPNSAHGILKQEMRSLGSLVMEAAENNAVPAHNALAVDRER